MRAKRRTEQEQYEIMMECRQSGLSDHQWCLEHDINPGTFFTRSVVFASRLVNSRTSRKRQVSGDPSGNCKNGEHSRPVNRSL